MHLDRFVRDLERVAPRGVRIAGREISAGDERALFEEERIAAHTHRLDRLRASGAARIAARTILGDFGHFRASLPRGPTGAPQWPPGIVGSLAHDDRIAVAVIASTEDCASLGVDVEPASPLPGDLVEMVATPRERAWLRDDRLQARMLFCAKEAIYKAVHPLDGVDLDHHDIEIEGSLAARLCGRRGVTVSVVDGVRIGALAFVPRGPP